MTSSITFALNNFKEQLPPLTSWHLPSLKKPKSINSVLTDIGLSAVLVNPRKLISSLQFLAQSEGTDLGDLTSASMDKEEANGWCPSLIA